MNKELKEESPEAMPRRIPALVTYLHPFRLIDNGTCDSWDPTIEEINTGTWDYVKLHEIVGGIDVGLKPPYHMAICFDGALALPPIPELRSTEKSVEFFNRCLGAILVGGVYCEAVTLDHVECGTILDWKYLRVYGEAKSFVNQFHFTARMKMAPPIHAIELMSPRRLLLTDLIDAAKNGYEILSLVPEINPEFLLKGITSLSRHDWSSALANLWILVEELTSHLWKRKILGDADLNNEKIPGRKDQLKDNRSWSASIKHELFFQLKIIGAKDLELSFIARKARNELVHQGSPADKKAAFAAFSLVRTLLYISTEKDKIALFNLDFSDHSLSDPFNPKHPSKIEPKYWMEIPKLPGEREIELEEAEQRSKGKRGS